MTAASGPVRGRPRPAGSRPVGLRWLLLPVGIATGLAFLTQGGVAAVLTTVPTLVIVVLLYARVVAWAARTEPDPRLGRVIWIGFGAKLLGFTIRYLVVNGVYGGGDATLYHQSAAILARSYRAGLFDTPVPFSGGQGAGGIKVITGLLYSVSGSSLPVGSLLFSLLSFTGVLLLVKGFRIGVPEGDHLRYGRLLLLLPSMWFWPSSIGKEAWMVFGLGLLVYGAARVYSRSPGGLVVLGLGAAACAYIRPHIAVVAAVAAAAALVLRARHPGRRFNRIGKALVLIPLVLLSLVLVSKSQAFLKVDGLNLAALQAAGELAAQQSEQGGSAFHPTPVSHVRHLPAAAITVLFRPFPLEARSALSFAISLEASFLLVLAVLSWRRILAGIRALRRTPYLALCAMATVAFVVAFSHFANFGILARERVQLLPFALAFLAATPGRRSGPATPDPVTEGHEPEPPRNALRWRVPDAVAG